MDSLNKEFSLRSNKLLLSSRVQTSSCKDNKVLSELNSKYTLSKINVDGGTLSRHSTLRPEHPSFCRSKQINLKQNIENPLLKSASSQLENKYLFNQSLYDESKVNLRKRHSLISPIESNIPKVLKLSRSWSTEDKQLSSSSVYTITPKSAAPKTFSDVSIEIVSEDEPKEEKHPLYQLEFGEFCSENKVEDNLLERTENEKILNKELLEVKLKVKLLHTVSCALIQGSNMRDPKNPLRKKILEISNAVAAFDPEFILKVALYTREELNIRTITNYLLAFCAFHNKCRIYLPKYFSSSVRLPSDWIEVADLYQHFEDKSIKPGSLPAILRKVMSAKFPDFDAYQLAKYNNENKMKKKRKQEKKLDIQEHEEATYSDILKSFKYLEKYFHIDDECCDDDENEEKTYKNFTIKQLVRLLHLTKPAEFVMALLGKKYPCDTSVFLKSGIPGFWKEELAGKRMKLPLPETWETQVSLKGNKSSTWEQLIDRKKLPFMAMLRNLRNFIMSGISLKHHKIIVNILTNEKAVIKSRQFPMRFLQAFKTMDELTKLLPELCKDLKMSQHNVSVPEHLTKWFQRKQKKLTSRKKRIKTDLKIVEAYKKALNESIKIATVYNVYPIPGTTLIFCDVTTSVESTPQPAKKSKTTPVAETALLLALMCKSACENCKLILFGSTKYREVSSSKRPLLEHASSLLVLSKYLSKSSSKPAKFPVEELNTILRDKEKIDNLIILSQSTTCVFLENYLIRYRHHVNPNLLFVNVDVAGKAASSDDIISRHENDVYLSGSSDQILRFIAERGNKSQLTHVENIDSKYKLKSLPRLSVKSELDNSVKQPSPSILIPKWRTVKVFISSTFRDMHGERDLLIRYVFPELRARAKHLFIDLQEIDFRWGITEEDASDNKLLAVCLNEVMKCDLFIGILGQRYGYVVSMAEIPDAPEFDWIRSYLSYSSITELEFHLGALADPVQSRGKAFFYFRNNEFLKNVPDPWKEDFIAEDEICKKKITGLKDRIRTSSLEVYDGYPCSWGGFVKDKPITADLEEFGKRVFNNIWNALETFYKPEDLEVSEDDLWEQETQLQEAFANHHNENFIGFKKNIAKSLEALKEKTSYSVIHGCSGSGKTALMAQLLKVLRQDQRVLVFPHFVGATPNSSSVSDIVSRLIYEISKQIKLSKSEATDDSGNSLNRFNFLLQKLAEAKWKVIFLLDGLDNVDLDSKAHILSWFPTSLPQEIKIICSIGENAQLLNELKNSYNAVHVKIRPLDSVERTEMVRQILSLNRKLLSESGFNNQMRLITSKREANVPLFLTLACEELRYFGLFENLTTQLTILPSTITGLLKNTLSNLEEDVGHEILQATLALLLITNHGLTEMELYDLINIYNNLHMKNFKFEDVLQLSIDANNLIPLAKFAKLIQGSKGFLKPVDICNRNAVLMLNHKEILKNYLGREKMKENKVDDYVIHKILAGYFYKLADPELNCSWSGGSIRALELLIPHLIIADCYDIAIKVLTDLHFLETKVKFGLQTQLLNEYHLLSEAIDKVKSDSTTTKTIFRSFASGKKSSKTYSFENKDLTKLEEYKAFIYKNYNYLMHSPAIFLQQALNEPDYSSPCQDARSLETECCSPKMFQWLNKPQDINPCLLMLNYSKPISSLAVSSDNQLVALGSSEGVIKILNINSGKEEKSLLGHANSVIGLCFLGSTKLCSASLDKTLSLWDVTQSFRIAVMSGHNRAISSCCASHENNMIVSVGLDCNIYVWNSLNGKEITSIKKEKSPINCVAFHPMQIKIFIGLWDGTVRIWDLVSMERKAILRGHNFSVTSIGVSNDGKYIASGDLKGEIRLWSATHGTQIGSFGGHILAVNRICFFSSNDCIATVGEDQKLKIWSSHLGQYCCTVKNSADVYATAVVPDLCGKYLIISYSNLEVHKVDMKTASVKFSLKMSSPISCLTIAKILDEICIIVGQKNGEIKVLNIVNGNELHTLCGQGQNVTALEQVGDFLVSGSEDGLILLHRVICKEENERNFLQVTQEEKPHIDVVTAIKRNPNKDGYFASCSRDRSVCVWYPSTYTSYPYDYFTIHGCSSDWITSCCWVTMEEKLSIMIGSANTHLTLLNLDLINYKAMEVKPFGNHEAPVIFIDEVNDHIISGSADGVIKFFAHNKAELNRIPCSPATHIAITSDIFNTDENDDDDSTDENTSNFWDNINIISAKISGDVEILHLKLGNELQSLTGHSQSISDLCITQDEKMITCSLDKTVRIWQSNPTGVLDECYKKIPLNHKRAILGIDFELTKNQILSSSSDGSVILWQMDKNFQYLEPVSSTKAHQKPVNSIVFIESDEFASACDDGYVKFWKIVGSKSIKCRYKFKKHFDYPIKKLSCEEGNLLTVSGWNGSLSVYSLSAKETIYRCGGINQSWINDAKFLPLNKNKVVFADEDSYLYSTLCKENQKPKVLKDLKKIQSFKSDTSDHPMVNCIQFTSSDSLQKCFVGTSDGKIAKISPKQETESRFNQIHRDSIVGIFMDLNTNILITASADHFIKAWHIDNFENFNLIGLFPCKAPATSFKAANSENCIIIVCGDLHGTLYCLKLK